MDSESAQALLGYVRGVAEATLLGDQSPLPPEAVRDYPYSGAFVTFRNGDRLRGCMGRLRATGPFSEALAEITQSSLSDPRFTHEPIEAVELADLSIEISILGPVQRVDDPISLVAGRHGVVVSRAGRSGCLLPQVATERGWSIETLLTECCRHKAGLPANAWRDPETTVEAFEVELLHEPGT